MVYDILLVLFFLTVPAGVMWLCSKVKWLGTIGPVLILYIIGLAVGNTIHTPGQARVQDILSSAMVPLAIPLMLFSCSFKGNRTRSQVLAMLSGIFAVVSCVVAGYLIFGRDMEEGAKVGGMLTGVYTGGTVNLAALKTMLGAGDELYILLNGYDMIISFIYLVVLVGFGIRVLRRFLPGSVTPAVDEAAATQAESSVLVGTTSGASFKGMLGREGRKDVLLQLGAAVLIIGISALVGIAVPDGFFMTAFILTLTTLGIAASFIGRLHNARYGYDMGMYLIYVFCVVVASMADFSKMDLSGSLSALGYLTFVIFGSLLLQILLSKLLRVDADTTVVSSVAFICSPPFVPMISAAMKNRSVLAPGLAIGIVGYAAGNYLGFLVYRLLEVL